MQSSSAESNNSVLVAAGCYAVRGILAVVYAVMKLFPTDSGKVLFLSRQADTLSLDGAMLLEELRSRNPNIKSVSLCYRVKDGIGSKLGFGIVLLRSLYHLATSQVVILDSYWPAVSVLRHKENLFVIQMWHALGKLKQSGRAAVGRSGGRGAQVSRIMKMHEGYDVVIAGGTAWNQYYCESFGCKPEALRNIGLPRIDYLMQSREENRRKVFEAYPELAEKPFVLYAPTFRRSGEEGLTSLLESFDFSRANLVVKPHPNQPLTWEPREAVYSCEGLTSLEVLSAADCLITDFSAITLESAVLGVPVFFYLFDYEDYLSRTGVNFDPAVSMPSCCFRDAASLAEALFQPYPQNEFDAFRSMYLPEKLGESTRLLADIVFAEGALAC